MGIQNGDRPTLHLAVPPSYLTFIATHIRLSSPFARSRVVDCYAYESPSDAPSPSPSLLTLNFLFASPSPQMLVLITCPLRGAGEVSSYPSSISTLFATTNWLERELGEMHGVEFKLKDDSRNLMLPYGDSSAPLQKCLPSIGLREIFYDSLIDSVSSRPVSIQF